MTQQPVKRCQLAGWKTNKKKWYAAYGKSALSLKTHADYKQKAWERLSVQKETQSEQKHLYFRQKQTLRQYLQKM